MLRRYNAPQKSLLLRLAGGGKPSKNKYLSPFGPKSPSLYHPPHLDCSLVPVPGFWFQGIYQAPGIWHQKTGPGSLVLVPGLHLLGTRYLAPGTIFFCSRVLVPGSTRYGTTPRFRTIKGRHQASINGIAPQFRLIVTSLNSLIVRRQTGNSLSPISSLPGFVITHPNPPLKL